MSSINEQYLTVQQVMKRIGARCPNTVIRKIRTPEAPGAPLVGEMVARTWLVTRISVDNYLRRERRRRKKAIPARGYPRGRPRAEEKTLG